jgi:hypothetical protein
MHLIVQIRLPKYEPSEQMVYIQIIELLKAISAAHGILITPGPLKPAVVLASKARLENCMLNLSAAKAALDEELVE